MRIKSFLGFVLFVVPFSLEAKTPLLPSGSYELRYSCEGRPLSHPAYATLNDQSSDSRWTFDIESGRFLYEHKAEVNGETCEFRSCGYMDYLRASDIVVMASDDRQGSEACGERLPFWGNRGNAWSLEPSETGVWGWNKLTDGLCQEGEAFIAEYIPVQESESARQHIERVCPNL